jgi:membrane-associated protease RseP (regulator of RpoE activity)
MVVLLGSGHVAYGLGAERQLAPNFKGQIRSLIPVRVRDFAGNETARVQASYADFVWGLPPSIGPEYPLLGISLAGALGSDPAEVIQVEKGSSAEQAGIVVGDILVSVNGRAISSSPTLQHALSGLEWGDVALVELRRGPDARRIPVGLRRPLPNG